MIEIILQRYRTDSSNQEMQKINLTGDVVKIGNKNYIDDGGLDMFDDGNYINTNLFPYNEFVEVGIPYTHTQQISSDEREFTSDGEVRDGEMYFGEGSTYFTNMYPYLFVLGVKNCNITHFSIDGGLGADGSGTVNGGSFQITDEEETPLWTCYYKTVNDSNISAGDPTVNHVIVVPGNGADSHTYSENTDQDTDEIYKETSITELYYILFSTRGEIESGRKAVNQAEIETIVNQFISNISETLGDTLSSLNANHAGTTNYIPLYYNFSDDGRDYVGLENITAVAYVGYDNTLADFRPRFLAADDELIYGIVCNSREANESGAVVSFIRAALMPITAMAMLDDVVYAVCMYIPFLIKMTPDGEFLNEVEDNKFDTTLSEDGIQNLIVSNGYLFGFKNNTNEVYHINTDSGNCTAVMSYNKDYLSICSAGSNPPLVSPWFISISVNETTNQFVIEGKENESFGDSLIVQWNPSGYDGETYGNPPTTGWTEVDFTIEENEESGRQWVMVSTSDLNALEFDYTNISFRVRYDVELPSEWIYLYWD